MLFNSSSFDKVARAFDRPSIKTAASNINQLAGVIRRKTWGLTKGAARLGWAGRGPLGALAIGAGMVGAFAYGMLEEPISSGALTQNLDITSGAASGYLLQDPGLMNTVLAANVRSVQGMSNMKGDDYMRGISRAAPPTGGPMMFSPQGSERGMKGGGDMGVTGNLALSLNNLRRGR